MPRLPPIYSTNYDNDLTEDVEEILARFQLMDSVRFEDFSGIWRDMCFSDVFRGISTVTELRRFCKVTMATAAKYFLPPYSYQIRVGGLYLIFAFYHTQPISPPANLRLSLKDWAHVQAFLNDTVKCGHIDVFYIYKKLNSIKAIHYTAMPNFLVFHKQRKKKQEVMCSDFLSRATAVQDLMTTNILEEVADVQGHYEKMKEATMEVTGQVTMTHQNLVSNLKKSINDFLSWQQKTFSSQVIKREKVGYDDEDDDDNDDDDEEEEESEQMASSKRAKLLSAIKQKSYSNFQEASKARRHRQVEVVDSYSSGAEQVLENFSSSGGRRRRRRPQSLRARTCKSLGMTQDDEFRLKKWLLSAPEEQDEVLRRNSTQSLKEEAA